jgi:glycosyltransferase involved in cell wall biosynthesis
MHVIAGFGGGGEEYRLWEEIRLADKVRFDIAVCHLGTGYTYADEVKGLGVTVYTLSGSTVHGTIPQPRVFTRLVKAVRDFQPDVLHLHLYASYFYGALVGRLTGVRGIVYTVASLKAQVQWWVFPVLFRFFRWGIDVFVTPRPNELIDYAGIPEQKIVQLRGMIDVSACVSTERESNPIIREFRLEDSFPVLLTVGRFVPSKGHDYAIRAVKHLIPHFPRVKLIALGEGEQYQELMDLIKSEGVADHVETPGFRRDIHQFYSVTDIYLRPCTIEGANLAHYLAMAHSRPCIGFDTGAQSEVIQDRMNGILVRNRDVSELVQAIVRLGRDSDLRTALGSNAREFVIKHRDLGSTVALYEGIYCRLGERQK